MGKFKDGFKLGLGFAVAVSIIAGITIAIPPFIVFVSEANTIETRQPEVRLSSLNHWISDNNIVFAGEIVNESAHSWKSIAIIFTIKDKEGEFLGTCREAVYDPPFEDSKVDFRAKCYDMPNEIEGFTYEVRFFGRY